MELRYTNTVCHRILSYWLWYSTMVSVGRSVRSYICTDLLSTHEGSPSKGGGAFAPPLPPPPPPPLNLPLSLEHKQLSHECCHSCNFLVPFPNQIFLQVGLGNLAKFGQETTRLGMSVFVVCKSAQHSGETGVGKQVPIQTCIDAFTIEV